MKGATCVFILSVLFCVFEASYGLVERECDKLEEHGGHCNHPNMELKTCPQVCPEPFVYSSFAHCMGDCCQCKDGFNMDFSTCDGLVVRECHDLEENGRHCNHPNMVLGKCLKVCPGPHSASSDCLGDCCRCQQGFTMDYATCQCNPYTDPVGQ
ncbi:uncharacterized protein LOC113386807 [Ctenocephalides felis]|uniref:uncharacterized protein LOC113386807 n=1 Tax=Ctenocephalides felis TaxID=7515 RepID=UPI000E6E1499|nr:uncharacterized protein LOC113386807 [Ctenocephalides felis]